MLSFKSDIESWRVNPDRILSGGRRKKHSLVIGILYGPSVDFYEPDASGKYEGMDILAKFNEKNQRIPNHYAGSMIFPRKIFHEKIIDKNFGIFPNRFLVAFPDSKPDAIKGITILDHGHVSEDGKRIRNGARPEGEVTLQGVASIALSGEDLVKVFIEKNGWSLNHFAYLKRVAERRARREFHRYVAESSIKVNKNYRHPAFFVPIFLIYNGKGGNFYVRGFIR